MLFAKREQEDRSAFRAGKRPQIFLDRGFGSACHLRLISASRLNRLMEPGAHDRHGLFGMRLDDVAHLPDGGFADLALDLADVDGAFAPVKRKRALRLLAADL